MTTKSTRNTIVIMSAQQSRLKTRKTSKPKKIRVLNESKDSENTPDVYHKSQLHLSIDVNTNNVGGFYMPWHVPFVESIKNETVEEEGVIQISKKQCEDCFITPKIENFVIDEWCEIGPSVHKNGHSPCPSGDNIVDVKCSPDTIKESLDQMISEPPQFDVNKGNEILKSSESDKAENKHSNDRLSTKKSFKTEDSTCTWQSLNNNYVFSSQVFNSQMSLQSSINAEHSNLAQNQISTHYPMHSSQSTSHISNSAPPKLMMSNFANTGTNENDSPSFSGCSVSIRSTDNNAKNKSDEQTQMLVSQSLSTNETHHMAQSCSSRSLTKFIDNLPSNTAYLYSDQILSKKPGSRGEQKLICLSPSRRCVRGSTQIQSIDTHYSEIFGLRPNDNVSFSNEVKNCSVLATKSKKLESEDKTGIDRTDANFDKLKVIQNSDKMTNVKASKGNNNETHHVEYDNEKTNTKYRMRQESAAKNYVICSTCGKYFRGKYHLRRHEMSHTETRPFICEVCNKCFKQKAHLNGHMKVHKKCAKDYTDNNGVKTNKLVQTSKSPGRPRKVYTEKELSCKKCGKCFKTVYRLKRHEQSHTDIRPFTCKLCGKGFKQSGHRNEHEANHEKSNKKRFLCNMCGVVFRCRSSFNNHMRSHNIERVRLLQTCTEVDSSLEITHTGYDCPYCIDKFATAQALNSHLETHVEVKHRRHVQPYSCDVCKRSFTYRHNLIKHKLAHKAPEKYALFHKEKIEAHMASGKPSFHCVVCTKVFIRKETLAKHFKIHSGKKPFKCSICCREFTQNVHLKVHMRKHTGSRPFQCKECNRGFIDSTALAKHIEYEACKSENALYRCKLCDKRHYYLGSIKQHIRKHHNVLSEENIEQYILKFERLNRRKNLGNSDKLTCKICNKSFTEKCNLVRHVRNKHSDFLELLTVDEQQLVDLKYLPCYEKKLLKLVPSNRFLNHANGARSKELSVNDCYIEVKSDTFQNPKTGTKGTMYTQNILCLEDKTVSVDNCRSKLLEGFNTAEMESLDYTDGHTQQSSRIFRSEYLDETALNDTEKDGRKYIKETSSQSDINFLYNIGLIVSSKAKKYKGENFDHVLYQQNIDTNDETYSVIKSISAKDDEETNKIVNTKLNSLNLNATDESRFFNLGHSSKDTESKIKLQQTKNDNFDLKDTWSRSASESNVQEMNLLSKKQKVTFKNFDTFELLPTIFNGEHFSDNSKNKNSYITLDNKSAKINNFENFFNQNCFNSESKYLSLAAQKSFSLVRNESCVMSADIYKKNPLNNSSLTLTGSDENVSVQKNEKKFSEKYTLSPAPLITSKTVSIKLGKDQSTEIIDSERFSPSASSSIHASNSNSCPVNNVNMKTEFSRKDFPHISDILSKQVLQFQTTEDEYESCPTESQLHCLGLLACRDSKEVISNIYPLHSLYCTFKPWLQDLVCNSKPKRFKDKCEVSSDCVSDMKETDENICEKYIRKSKSNPSVEVTSPKKCLLQDNIIQSKQDCLCDTVDENKLINSEQCGVLTERTSHNLPTVQFSPCSQMPDSMSLVNLPKTEINPGVFPSSLVMTSSQPASPDMTPQCRQNFACSVCAKLFGARHQLKRHELTHTDLRPYNCDKCGRAFRQKVHLSDHIKRHQGERPFVCEGCGKSFVLKNEMNQHIKNHCKGGTSAMLKSEVEKSYSSVGDH